ncbi:PREDICTED: fatty acid amide hydrolase-like isoform X2 [Nelumbo nucifera]|uniref:Fatty acid amide hydrolase-like isoform X2 n=1 Tax=Nelumbo nucifera TaxID=4432 RepID=A0A1U7Z889_NELNU|nr:PREDICTED: fatty acid amide hydrolase-like isoform X2 [Nelumbo nucifera]
MGWFFKTQRVIYKPVEEVDLSPDSDEVYLRANVKAPRMAGFLIKIAAWILESRILGAMLVYILKGENLIHKLVSFAELKEPPVYVPYHPWKDLKEQEAKCIPSELPPSEKAQHAVDCLPLCSDVIINTQQPTFRRWTIQDYSRAYISGETTPLVVAKSFLDALHASSTPPLKMSFFISYNAEDILRQATESTLRYERGEPISVLDGVPIAVKDEIDSKPYQTTGGTKWLHKLRHCTDDACCVKHLRSCGAIIVGKTNMHELGVGTSGINPHYGATRNPYDPSKVTGGSSSGSAAVVSAGLCPVALGVDGGGSVRIPASLCGVIGFKPTFGRVSHSGVLPLNWTVGMVGILAGTVEDALIVYAAISGHHPSNQPTILPPKINLPLLKSEKSMSRFKIAKYKETVDVTLPEIEVMRLAHYLTIGSECNASIRPHLEKMDVAELGCDARVALRIYGAFNSREYLNAQRIRNRQMHFYKHILERADFIVIPTTGVTAYPIMEDALKYGDFDYINGAALVRYQIAGNFLGLPAVTVPVGYDKSGMPIGLQFIGRPWSESTLLHIAFAVQVLSIQSYRKPKVFYNLLSKKEEP